MTYIDDINDQVEEMTPESGFNVCSFDDFDNELTLLGHFETEEEAEEYAGNFDSETIYIYGESDEGTEVQQDFSQQKSHNIPSYIDKAVDDYEKGTNSPNDDYEKKNYGGESSPYGIQNMLDDIVGKSLGKEEKKKVEEELDGEFTLENLMKLTAKYLADKAGKKLGVEAKSNEGVNQDGITCEKCGRHFDPMDDFMMTNYNRHMRSHSATEVDPETERKIRNDIESSEAPETYEDLDRWALRIGVDPKDYHEVFEKGGYMYEDEFAEMYESATEAGGTMGNYMSAHDLYGKPEVTPSEGNTAWNSFKGIGSSKEDWVSYGKAWGLSESEIERTWNLHKTFESKASEDHVNDYWKEYNYAKRMMKDEGLSGKGDEFKWVLMDKGISIDVADRIANEGGKGSGRKGHQKWMLGAEAGDECPNCMMITDKNESGNCEICGA